MDATPSPSPKGEGAQPGTGSSIPKPSELARQWHPYNFSDSTTEEVPAVSKSVLEFQLAELTTLRKETEFEEFARQLAQRELCPNLVPQTGPVGGGDSHTDSETYPVSPELAAERYWGPAAPAVGQNWAFAFSAQKTYAAKARSDVAKIAALPRRYEKVFFITNQAVRDKTRRELETELATTYRFDVRILDRTWIVDQVISKNHADLLKKALRLDLPVSQTRRVGPNDAERLTEIEELLTRLRNPRESFQTPYELACAHLRAGRLAAHLERPRTEVESHFSQALAIARRISHRTLQAEILYQKAWKSFWWYDDFQATADIFVEMLPLLADQNEAATVELFSTIQTCLLSAIVNKHFTLPKETFDEWTRQVRGKLEAMAGDAARPHNALYAKTVMAFRQLAVGFREEEKVREIFEEIGTCLQKSERFAHFPFLEFVDSLKRLGEQMCDRPGYSALMEKLEPMVAERAGRAEAGKLALGIGSQLFGKERYAEAIPPLTRAAVRLTNLETRRESVQATCFVGLCFEALGLQWAARSYLLTALHFSSRDTDDFLTHGPFILRILTTLCSIELMLGRLGPFLAWYELATIDALKPDPTEDADLVEALPRLEGVLCVWLANLADEDITELRDAVSALEKSDLGVAAGLLALRLGETPDTSTLVRDLQALKWPLGEMVEKFRQQPAAADLPSRLSGETRAFWTMRTDLFGVRFSVKVQNLPEFVWLAEEMLGALEAIAAFARPERLAFIEEEFECTIVRDEKHTGAPKWEANGDDYSNRQRLVFGADAASWLSSNPVNQESPVRDFVLRALLSTTIDPPDDVRAEFKRLFEMNAMELAFSLNLPRSICRILVGDKRYVLSER